MIMIAGNIARTAQSLVETTLGRIAVSVYQAFSQGFVRIVTTDPEVDPVVEERMLSDPSRSGAVARWRPSPARYLPCSLA